MILFQSKIYYLYHFSTSIRPALGLCWANCINTRIFIKRLNSFKNLDSYSFVFYNFEVFIYFRNISKLMVLLES